MNLIPVKTDFSAAEHIKLRGDVEQAKVNDGLSEADIAREAEIAPASLNQYLKGKYPAERGNAEMAAKLHRWLQDRTKSAEVRARMPKAPTFLSLHGAQSIMAKLAYAREVGRIIIVAGAPGVQKTAAARQYCASTPRAWYTAMDDSITSVPAMLLEILGAMGEPDTKGMPPALARRVCQRAGEAKGLIVVDEAHKLTDKCIEMLRAINDRVRVGVALLGNTEAYTKVGPTATKELFAQVSSRIARRQFILAPDPRDAEALSRAWAEENREVLGPKELAFCQLIAARPGGLRNIEMTMEGALMAAFGEGEPLELRHLQGSFSGLSGQG